MHEFSHCEAQGQLVGLKVSGYICLITKSKPLILEAQNVVKRFAQHLALDGVSLAVAPQRIFGLLGPNGAGKTTLIRIINQITMPDQGQVLFDGQPLRPVHIARLGYLPEERGLYKKMKVGEQLLYLARLRGLSRRDALSRIAFWNEKLEIGQWHQKKLEDLSKGMQQKVQFVATVLHQPDLLILDEPFSGFDPVNANKIKDEILELRDKGTTILFSTHRMESVEELCDDICLIHKSKIILSGTKQEIKNQYKTGKFIIESPEPIMGLQEGQILVKTEQQGGGIHKSIVRIENDDPQSFLKQLVNQQSILSFQELVPSINDIFIQNVTEPIPATE